MLAAVTEDRVIVLSESVMHSSMCGDLSIVQTTNCEVSIHLGGMPESWIEDTSLVVKGLSVARTCFVVWSGKAARVYRVDAQIRSIEPIEPFLTNGQAIAIADASHIIDEALFIADQGMIRVFNFGGTQKGSIAFTEAEGNPLHLDINNKYLAAVTNFGVVKILDVHAPTKPKLLGSAGRICDPATGAGIGGQSLFSGAQADYDGRLNNLTVRKIRVNCDGTRVAVLVDLVEGALQVLPKNFLNYYLSVLMI